MTNPNCCVLVPNLLTIISTLTPLVKLTINGPKLLLLVKVLPKVATIVPFCLKANILLYHPLPAEVKVT